MISKSASKKESSFVFGE